MNFIYSLQGGFLYDLVWYKIIFLSANFKTGYETRRERQQNNDKLAKSRVLVVEHSTTIRGGVFLGFFMIILG